MIKPLILDMISSKDFLEDLVGSFLVGTSLANDIFLVLVWGIKAPLVASSSKSDNSEKIEIY